MNDIRAEDRIDQLRAAAIDELDAAEPGWWKEANTLTADLKFALEESNRVCKVPNYFGYTDAKQHAWETLPTRNDQLLAVLKLHQPYQWTESVPVFDEFDSPIENIDGCTCRSKRYPCPTIEAIQEAA